MPVREPIELPDGPISRRLETPRVDVPDRVIEALQSDLGAANVEVADDALVTYGRDWWPLAVVWATQGKVPAPPAVVARVTTPDQVGAVVRRCRAAGIPLTTAAGRSGVCGGALPVAGGVVLDVSGLDQVIDVDDRSLLLRVQAGVFGDVLEADLRRRGYTLGHWPQSIEISTVGGWLACRSAGQYSTRYGKIEDMVVGLRAVTGAGRFLETGGPPRAAVGPDLTQVVVGSEGTLAVVTEATLRVHPAPPHEERVVYGFGSFEDGLEACRRVLRRGATPAVLRLYDATESQRNFEHDTNVLVVIDEGDPHVVAAAMAVTREECEDTAGCERLDEGLAARWLEHRNDVSALPTVVKAGVVVDTIELAASWSTLPRLYSEVCDALAHVDGSLVASAHCSHSYLDGACLYFTFAGRPGAGEEERTPSDEAAAKDNYYRASIDTVMERAVELGAAISHHHGVGMARGPWVERALGETAFETLLGLKRVFDPAGILNPGKLGLPSPFLPDDWAWS